MRVLELSSEQSPLDRGHAHGETFRELIQEIAALRTQLCIDVGDFNTTQQVHHLASLHLPLLEQWYPDLHQELLGIAQGANITAAEIVVINHYTDLRDLDSQTIANAGLPPLDREKTYRIAPQDGDADECSALYARHSGGTFLGQTWDMHASASPYVVMLGIPEYEGQPAAWLLSITGCLGMAGLNSAGIGVTINNLRSTDARIGIVWPALVRAALQRQSAPDARDVFMDSPLGSGHHYLVASREFCYGIETSGLQKTLVFHGQDQSYLHTNHCLASEIERYTTIPQGSSTHDRYALLQADIGDRPIKDAYDLWTRLGSHQGYPRSVCSHLATLERPHASSTCSAIAMDLTRRFALAAHGCIYKARAHHFEF